MTVFGGLTLAWDLKGEVKRVTAVAKKTHTRTISLLNFFQDYCFTQ